MNLFIDTNVYLGFYSSRKGSSETLLKLKKLIGKNEVALILPEQVKDEFHRNIPKFALDFDKQAISFLNAVNAFHVPTVLEDWSEIKKFEEFRDGLNDVCKKAQKEYASRITHVKGVINETIESIFKMAKVFPVSKEIAELARLRRFRGNPPGKKEDDGGDAIIWETLLSGVKNDLHFVTYDNDWGNPLDNKKFSPFLVAECKEQKRKIHYFSTIGEALNSIAEKQVISKPLIQDEKEFKSAWETISQLNNISNKFSTALSGSVLLKEMNKIHTFNMPTVNFEFADYFKPINNPFYQAALQESLNLSAAEPDKKDAN